MDSTTTESSIQSRGVSRHICNEMQSPNLPQESTATAKQPNISSSTLCKSTIPTIITTRPESESLNYSNLAIPSAADSNSNFTSSSSSSAYPSSSQSTISLTANKAPVSPPQIRKMNALIPKDPENSSSTTIDTTSGPDRNRRPSRVAEMLHRAAEIPSTSHSTTHLTPPSSSPSAITMVLGSQHSNGNNNSNSNTMGSQFSSTDSLASLVERQHLGKINHPHHQWQLFGNDAASTVNFAGGANAKHTKTEKVKKRHSILFETLQRATNYSFSTPIIKSPLHLSSSSASNMSRESSLSSVNTDTAASATVDGTMADDTRKLHPSQHLLTSENSPYQQHHFNNLSQHIHSSPSVKSTTKVNLEYDPLTRKQILNSYEIVRELGRGEHGKVKLAKDLESGELVAIKIVDRKGPRGGRRLPKFSQRTAHDEDKQPQQRPVIPVLNEGELKIRKEIAIMKKLSHPNIVKLQEVLDDPSSRKIYLILEYLSHGEVQWQHGKGSPVMTLSQSLKVFRDVLLGLEYLHYQGIIHRDIKPANLLLGVDGVVKISDFGVSYISTGLACEDLGLDSNCAIDSAELTDPNVLELELAKTAGTPAFFAPELCQPLVDSSSGMKVSYKIDIWALGVTLYCFIFGDMPFWGSNEFELFQKINNDKLRFPTTYPQVKRPDCSEIDNSSNIIPFNVATTEWNDEEKFEVRNLLFKLLAKDPAHRITIPEIKRHPLVLKGLSVRQASEFMNEQSCCYGLENKIDVTKVELDHAVGGIGGRLKQKWDSALRFAAALRPKRSRSNLNDDPSTAISASVSTTDLNHSILYTTAGPITAVTTSIKGSSASHIRSKSQDLEQVNLPQGKTTKATVEGDLFLSKSSHALDSLNHLVLDDIKRGDRSIDNVLLPGNGISTTSLDSDPLSDPNSSSSSSTPGSDSITDNKNNKSGGLVSLPINASFASLDSVYLDNYAPAYSQNNINSFTDLQQATTTPTSFDPTHNKSVSLPVTAVNSMEIPTTQQAHNDEFIIRPRANESTISIPAQFMSQGNSYSSTGRGDIFGRNRGALRTDRFTGQAATKVINPTSSELGMGMKKKDVNKGDKPKYSFFENSSDESGTDGSDSEDERYGSNAARLVAKNMSIGSSPRPGTLKPRHSFGVNGVEIEFANSSDEDENSQDQFEVVIDDAAEIDCRLGEISPMVGSSFNSVVNPPKVTPTAFNLQPKNNCNKIQPTATFTSKGEQEQQEGRDSDSNSSDSEDSDLFLTFNRSRCAPARARTNTITINPSLVKQQHLPFQPSPLSIQHQQHSPPVLAPSPYINHYQKVTRDISTPILRHASDSDSETQEERHEVLGNFTNNDFNDNGIPFSKDSLENGRSRSNSITVGILEHLHDFEHGNDRDN